MTKPTGGKVSGRLPAMDAAIMKAPAVSPKPMAVKPILDMQGGSVLKGPATPPKKK